MCEAMENSNDHAHKDFKTKTMRGGGNLYNPDPLFFEGFLSYCHYLDIVSKHKRILVSDTLDKLQNQFQPTTTFPEICKNVVKPAIIEEDSTRDSSRLQSGLRFHVVGHFTGTTGKAVEETITRLGGSVEQRKSPWTNSKRNSSTTNCFVVVKSDTEMLRAIKIEKNAASRSDSDTCSSNTQ